MSPADEPAPSEVMAPASEHVSVDLPTLLERYRSGETHEAKCPGCDTTWQVRTGIGFPICDPCVKRFPDLTVEERLIWRRTGFSLAEIISRRGKGRQNEVGPDRLSAPALFEKATANQAVADWARSPRKSLVLFGPVGTGKSWQAVGALRAILESSRGFGYLVNCAGLARLGRDGFEVHSRCTALALDDLGARLTPAALTAAYELIEYRHANLLPLIVTTNLSPASLAAVDERIDSRLAGALWIEMRGADRRMS